MKVVFLDIDGVLNCKRTPNPRKFPFIVDPVLLERLRRLLDLTGAEIVLSSSWRFDPVGLLAARHFEIPFADTIPDEPDQPRCQEILDWLRAHPEVERFAVIDDQDDELDPLPLFQPSRRTGLTDEMANAAADYLNGKSDKDMRRSKLARICQNIASRVIGHKG